MLLPERGQNRSPLDRLIDLIAEIEVAGYLNEVQQTGEGNEDERCDLCPLQRGPAARSVD